MISNLFIPMCLYGAGRSSGNFTLPEITDEERQKMKEYSKTHKCQFSRNKKKKRKLRSKKINPKG